MGKMINPKGYVVFLNQKVPVTWGRETNRYVYDIKRLEKENNTWKTKRKNFEDKMDKSEILNGNFQQEYVPLKEQNI